MKQILKMIFFVEALTYISGFALNLVMLAEGLEVDYWGFYLVTPLIVLSVVLFTIFVVAPIFEWFFSD
jgi:hypothetical protein